MHINTAKQSKDCDSKARGPESKYGSQLHLFDIACIGSVFCFFRGIYYA